MYKYIIRPLLFLFDPEKIHHFIVFLLKYIFIIPGSKKIGKIIFRYENKALENNILGIKFTNPIGLAAGFDKDSKIINEIALFGFSFIEVGTITPKPQKGNAKPRLFRLLKDEALINRMGFNNLGVDQAIAKLKKRKPGIIIGGNIGKNTTTPNDNAADDYEYCFKKLYNHVDYFVINISCPNISDLEELQNKEGLNKILEKVIAYRKIQTINKPILIKISPDLNLRQVDDIIEIAGVFGVDGFVISNTTTLRDGLSANKGVIEKIGNGGLSGKPLSKKSTELIRYVSEKTNYKIPIIGTGGIMNEQDAIEKLEAGASLIQLYTGFIYEGPFIVKRIKKSLIKHKFSKN